MSDVSPGKLTRQQLYDRIKKSTKDEYILEEMKRLGFWENSDKPSVSEELIKEKATLQKELAQLLRSKRLLQDPEKALELMHKERKKKALESRKKTKIERIKSAYQRALAWYNLNQKTITYLGDKSKIEFSKTVSNIERLDAQKLPPLHQPTDLADAMGISLSELRFLTYNREVSKVSHYKCFSLAKKTGGLREISAPMPRLKRAQYWLKANILEQLALHDAAHGFVTTRSIVSNATPHIGQSIVINMDLKDFFPTITYRRVKGLFHQLGYSETLSVLFGLLTTEPKYDEVSIDSEVYFVARGERRLPQGAPTSPMIANLICRKLDRRISHCAQKLGFEYTRYADDLTFSHKSNDSHQVQQLLWRVNSIIKDESFRVHPNKTRIMRAHQQQEVTGIIVNEKVNLSRKKIKKLRATLFQIEKDGFSGKYWDESEDVFRSLIGFVNYLKMVNPTKAEVYKKQLVRIIKKYQPEIKKDLFIGKVKKSIFIDKSIKGKAAWRDWWQPSTKAAPELVLPKEKGKKKPVSQENTSSSTEVNANASMPDATHPKKYTTVFLGKVFLTVTLGTAGLLLAPTMPAFLILIVYIIYRIWKLPVNEE